MWPICGDTEEAGKYEDLKYYNIVHLEVPWEWEQGEAMLFQSGDAFQM